MAQNPYDMNIVKHLYAATGGSGVDLGQRQAILRQLVSSDQRLMAPATMLVMNEEANLRDKAMKQGGQPPVAMQKLGFAPPAPPAGLGAIGPQGGGMPAPQGPQMASAAPMGMPAPMDQPPVGMAAGGMTELPASVGGGLTTLPLPDDMYNEESFGGGGIVAFSKGGQKGEADARARAKKQAEAYLGKPISDEDFDMLLKATYAESSVRSNPAEAAMITGSILNRARDIGSIPGALSVKNAFQSVTGTPKNRTPSERFLKGPSEQKAATIFNAMDALPRVPREQKDFTSALPGAYKKGTNISYLEEMKKSPTATRYGDSQFPMMLMAPKDGGPMLARNEPPAPTASAVARSVLPGIPSAQAQPTFGPSLTQTGLSALNAINPIGTAYAGEVPKPQAQPPAAPKVWRDRIENPEYYSLTAPDVMPDTIDPEKKLSDLEVFKRAAGNTVGAGVVDYFRGLGNVAMTPIKAGSSVLNALDRFANKPRGMPVEGEQPLAAPVKAPTDRAKYNPANDPMLKRIMAAQEGPPAAATPSAPSAPGAPGSAVSGVDARFKQLMDLVGQGPQLKGASAEELAAQRDQDVGMALLNAAAKGLSSKDPTLLGSLGAAAEGAMPALAESAKERKVRERELRQAEFDRDKTMFGVKGEAAKYALGIGESADENLYREYMSAPPERQRLIEKYLAAKSPYGNLSAQLGRDKFEAEQLKSHLDDIIRTPVSQLAPELGITNEAEKRAYIARGRQALLSAASTGGGGGFGAPPPGAVRQRNS